MDNENSNPVLRAILVNHQQADGSQRKMAATGRVRVHQHGLESEDGGKEYYDNADCALLNYAQEHYAFWQTYYPDRRALFDAPGIFGENFVTQGITEPTLCAGDIFNLGSAQIQVSWGREACHTMAERLHDDGAPDVMHQQSRNGWFYRVLQAGEVQCGDALILIDRPHAAWPLSRVQRIIFNPHAGIEELTALAQITELAQPWRQLVNDRLTQRCGNSA